MGYAENRLFEAVVVNSTVFGHEIRNDSGNGDCDSYMLPSAMDYVESLGVFGVSIISIGAILSTFTLFISIDTLYNVMSQKETSAYKVNCLFILVVYPIASLCSLLGTAVPRSQLLSEALTQISLTIALYRLYLLLIDLGHRSVAKPPLMTLRVEPCCCWPCLPFPNLELNKANLAWLRLCVLQLPIIQGLTYCVFLFLNADDHLLEERYGIYLQPFAVSSILLGIYGITVTSKTLHDSAPDASLNQRAVVSKLVLLFSKLQGFIIKCLPATGVFPCNPPLTPRVYAHLTYNCLMMVQMLLLSYAAKQIYARSEGAKNKEDPATDATKNNEPANVQLPARIAALTA